jgi:hypothetical protein
MRTYLITDVDGVINCETKDDDHWLDEWGWGQSHGEAEALVANGAEEPQPFPLRWSPFLIFRLNRLVAIHDVHPVWLTTWCELAQTRLPQITGLNCSGWPVLGEREYDENRDGEWWKLTALRNWYEQQTDEFRFVWIDDQLRRRGCLLWTASLPEGQVLPINPVSRFGISPDEMDQIERFAQ